MGFVHRCRLRPDVSGAKVPPKAEGRTQLGYTVATRRSRGQTKKRLGVAPTVRGCLHRRRRSVTIHGGRWPSPPPLDSWSALRSRSSRLRSPTSKNPSRERRERPFRGSSPPTTSASLRYCCWRGGPLIVTVVNDSSSSGCLSSCSAHSAQASALMLRHSLPPECCNRLAVPCSFLPRSRCCCQRFHQNDEVWPSAFGVPAERWPQRLGRLSAQRSSTPSGGGRYSLSTSRWGSWRSCLVHSSSWSRAPMIFLTGSTR